MLDGIAFGRADLAESVAEGDRVDVVATLASRTFGGFESLQLIVRDVAPSGSHPAAAEILAAARRRVMAGPATLAPADGPAAPDPRPMSAASARRGPRRPRSGDPYGIRPSAALIAPAGLDRRPGPHRLDQPRRS